MPTSNLSVSRPAAANIKWAYEIFVFCVVFGSIVINVILSTVGNYLNGLLFLDTIGTAIAAVTLGPWWGAFVGAATNFSLAEIPCRQQYFNYLIVNVLCGIIWGYLARVRPKLFIAQGKYLRLFIILFSFGTIVGFISSTLALFTTFNFVWHLSDIDPEHFRRWHLTDEYYRWLLKSSELDVKHGTLLSVVYRDIIAILPDKIVAICIATVVMYYAIPRDFLLLRGKNIAKDLFFSRLSLWLFTCFYSLCFGLLIYRGNISIDPSTCQVNGYQVIAVQRIIWAIPLVAAIYLIWCTRRKEAVIYLTGNPVINSDVFEEKPKKYVFAVYKDLLSILAAVFALLIAIKQGAQPNPSSPVQQIANLLSDGLGMAAFFALALFMPGFIFRLFNIGPEVEVNEE